MRGQLDAGKMKGEHVQGRETDSATSGFTKVCDRMMGHLPAALTPPTRLTPPPLHQPVRHSTTRIMGWTSVAVKIEIACATALARIARACARKPALVITICTIFSLACGAGVLRIKIESDGEIWTGLRGVRKRVPCVTPF